MKLISADFRKGFAKMQVESQEDLWYLSSIIEKGDIVSASTLRKIKIDNATEKGGDVIKIRVFLDISVEKVEFHKYSDILRVSGTILEGKEDIPKGSYHTIPLEENVTFELKKKEFLKYQIEKINEACQEKKSKILMIVMDREEAHFALLKKFGYQILTSIKGDVQKKVEGTQGSSGNFYTDMYNILKEYVQRYEIEFILLASPSFFKEDFVKSIKDIDLKSKIVLATCSSTDKTAFDEVLKRTEVQNIIRKERTAKESVYVEKLLEEISKNGKSAYGLKHVGRMAMSGAVETILITDELIRKYREEDKYDAIDGILRSVDKANGEIIIVSSDNDAGKKLDGLGGIGAILRYRLEDG